MMATKQAVFQLGEDEYGLDIMDVNTVEKYISVEKVANSLKNIKGVIRLRGDVIPVYSLRSKFGLEEKEPDHVTRLIITNSNGSPIAYEVDRMCGIENIEPEQLYEAPSVAKNKDTAYMKQVANLNGRLIILMDHNGILTNEEQDGIKNLAKK
jgi:purine-binding chemotaxis protein CheW